MFPLKRIVQAVKLCFCVEFTGVLLVLLFLFLVFSCFLLISVLLVSSRAGHTGVTGGEDNFMRGLFRRGKFRRGNFLPLLRTPKLTLPHAHTALPKPPDF